MNKVSPVEASTRYLQHIREAWNQAMARGREGAALEEQLIIITVPASFDEIARELTLKAAHQAGLPRVVLLEEPLAAFYAWISGHVPSLLTAESGFSGQESGSSTVEENFAASPSPDPSHQTKRLPENPPQSPFTKGGLPAPPLSTGGLPAPPFSTGELPAPPFTKGGSGGIFPTGVTQELNSQTASEGLPVPLPAPVRSTAGDGPGTVDPGV